MTWSTD